MKKFYRKPWFYLVVVPPILLLFAWSFRIEILIGIGNHLISMDEPQQCDAIFVMSGNSRERGTFAAEMALEGHAPIVVFLGSEDAVPLNLEQTEWMTLAERAAQYAGIRGLDSTRMVVHPHGTSTFEEYLEIKKYSESHGFTKVMVVSTNFHTRRIRMIMEDGLEDVGAELIICAVAMEDFSAEDWWQSERGLIYVNNEWVKLVYYWWKY